MLRRVAEELLSQDAARSAEVGVNVVGPALALAASLDIRCQRVSDIAEQIATLASEMADAYGWVQHEHVGRYAEAFLRLSRARPQLMHATTSASAAALRVQAVGCASGAADGADCACFPPQPATARPVLRESLDLLGAVGEAAQAALEVAEAAIEVAGLARAVAEEATRSRERHGEPEPGRAEEDDSHPSDVAGEPGSAEGEAAHAPEESVAAEPSSCRAHVEARVRQHRLLCDLNDQMLQLQSRARRLLQARARGLLPQVGYREKHRVFAYAAELLAEALRGLAKELVQRNEAKVERSGSTGAWWRGAVERCLAFLLGGPHVACSADTRQALFRYAACLDRAALRAMLQCQLFPRLASTLEACLGWPPPADFLGHLQRQAAETSDAALAGCSRSACSARARRRQPGVMK